MDKILTKKFNELELLLDRFMEDATLLSSVDSGNLIEKLMDNKISEFNKQLSSLLE
jgi:hypothetical protein